jgi:hypothetical protein
VLEKAGTAEVPLARCDDILGKPSNLGHYLHAGDCCGGQMQQVLDTLLVGFGAWSIRRRLISYKGVGWIIIAK